jgi:uncharacterized protein (TIGR02145 family)
MASCKTGNSKHSNRAGSVNPKDSIVTDRDGNKYPVKVLSDGNLWMTTNLNLNIPESYCYDNAKENCEQYGRLYTWESAKQACAILGAGWQLPTSNEWRQLSKLYGGTTEDSTASRKAAFSALLHTGNSGFNARLGGGRSHDADQYARKEAHGFYWTSTEIDGGTAWNYNFAKGSQALYQQDGGEKESALSVRCIKRIDN